ncbi:MAG: hypothetical protein WC974_00585 [Thermoplasmata archaeon]
MKIGVLAIRGAVSEHIAMVKMTMNKCGVNGTTCCLKEKKDVENIDGLITPGGESMIISKFISNKKMSDIIQFSDSVESAELTRTQKNVQINVDDIWTNDSKENCVSFITEILSERKSL